MSFVPAENFATRSKPLYDAETQRIDVIMYKITEATHADGLIRAVKRGVPVRLITEPDRYRNTDNIWQAYQIDRLYMAGVQIRDRAHAGFTASEEHAALQPGDDDFRIVELDVGVEQVAVRTQLLHDQAVVLQLGPNNFTRKWGNTTGNVETEPFVPLPPDAPVYVAPANAATNVSTSTATIVSWKPGPWSHLADIRFGTSPSPPLARIDVGGLAELDEDLHAASARAGHDLLLAGRQQDDCEAAASGPGPFVHDRLGGHAAAPARRRAATMSSCTPAKPRK